MERPRDFEWDDAKAEANLAKHRVAFRTAISIFVAPQVLTIDVSRPEDNEERYKAIGLLESRLIVVVDTVRGESLRVISARRANLKEKKLWLELR
jgi:uncharacterized protein